jgi:hypothetical protein
MRVVTERVTLRRLAPFSRLPGVALRIVVRGVLEGVWWVVALVIFRVNFLSLISF